jgi:predicted MPP superfamily phosphohydrolase
VSQNGRVLAAAVRWVRAAAPDLVVLTGDLLARPRGEAQLRRALAAFAPRHGTFAVLGNVDVADTRDPFSSPTRLASLAPHGTLLEDAAALVEIRGHRIQLVGCAPVSRERPPVELADPAADLRILLAHFPESVDAVPPGVFQLVLAGHTHGGQICLPYPGGKLRFGGFDPPYPEGVFRLEQATLVVSRGLGTTFVPFRFFARPEATVLVLRGA